MIHGINDSMIKQVGDAFILWNNYEIKVGGLMDRSLFLLA